MVSLPSILGNSTKEKILGILLSEWPLTAKKVYYRLKKDHSLSLSYQATYKALNELKEEKILEKIDNGYKINKDWAEQLGDFSKKVKDELGNTNYKKELKSSPKMIFDNHGEFIKFHIDLIEEIIKKEGKLKMDFHYRHIPHPFILTKGTMERLERLMPNIDWTILSKKDSPVGRWNAKQWEKLGVKTKIGVDISSDSLIIMNNNIINIYTPIDSIKKWDERTSKLEDYEIRPTQNVKSRNKAIITIMTDKEIAERLRNLG